MDFDEEETRFKVRIDKDNLDTEWQQQGELVFDYSMALSEAILKRDTAKNFVECTFARIFGDAEDEPDSYGLKRVTDATLKYAARREEEYQNALAELAKAERLVSKLWGALKALENKREGLRGETKLYLSNYYAEDTMSDRVKERYTESLKKRKEKRNEP